MEHLGEGFAFKLSVIFVTVVIIIISAFNIFYFNRIRQNPTTNVSSSTASWMIAANIIVLVIAMIIFIWALVKIVPSTVYEPKKINSQMVYNLPPPVPVERMPYQPALVPSTTYPCGPSSYGNTLYFQ